MKNQSTNGFSLVEVSVALGIVAFALIAILGLVPVGMKSARDAENDTRSSLIAQDAYNRIRAKMTINNDPSSPNFFTSYPSGQASFFYYSDAGIPSTNGLSKVAFSGDTPAAYASVAGTNDYYRAKVVVSQMAAPSGTPYPASDPRSGTDLLCATVEIGWPVNGNDGSVVGTNNSSRATHVFYLRKP